MCLTADGLFEAEVTDFSEEVLLILWTNSNFISMENKIRVLFVCLGNICRSPMAEGIFRHLVEQEGLAPHFHIDSAGTSGWHAGEKPDRRMRQTAQEHGLSLENQRSRQFIKQDFQDFDYILAMDRSNLRNIQAMQHGPNVKEGQVTLMLEHDPKGTVTDVPDPYYGGQNGFEEVYDLLLKSNRAFLDQLKAQYSL